MTEQYKVQKVILIGDGEQKIFNRVDDCAEWLGRSVNRLYVIIREGRPVRKGTRTFYADYLFDGEGSY